MERPTDLDLLNARRPAAGVVSGGQPTRAQLRAAAEAGYRSVLTTRGPFETPGYDERADVEGLGMAFYALPVETIRDLSRANVEAFAKLVEDAEKPLLIHCGSGNRLGALFALEAAWLRGATPEEAMQRGRECGLTGLATQVAMLLQRGA